MIHIHYSGSYTLQGIAPTFALLRHSLRYLAPRSLCFSRSISLVSAVVRAPHLILLQVYEKPGFTHRGMQNMIKMHSMNCLLLLLQGVDPHPNLSTLLSAAECTQTFQCTDMLALLFAAK